MSRPISIVLCLFFLLAACSSPVTPIPLVTSTPNLTPAPSDPTATPPEAPSSTPVPAWMTTLEGQDPQDKFFQVEAGKPVVTTYDTLNHLTLVESSIKTTATTDVLFPNLISAQGQDANGNIYDIGFNPNYGWFQIPDVQMDYSKLEQYTPVTTDFFFDGRFAWVSAYRYAENPTISPNAIIPQFWVNYGGSGNSNYVDISMNPHTDLYRAQSTWPTLIKYYTSANKPFAWAGFYKVYYNNGADYFYTIGQTIKTGENQTQGFAHGISRSGWEEARTRLKDYFDGINNGRFDISMILAPPDGSQFLWNPDLVSSGAGLNPVVAALQQRGELISLFSLADQETILKVLNQTPVPYDTGRVFSLWTAPINSLPPNLSKYILLSGQG